MTQKYKKLVIANIQSRVLDTVKRIISALEQQKDANIGIIYLNDLLDEIENIINNTEI